MSRANPLEPNASQNSFMALSSLDQVAMDAFPEAVYVCAEDGRVVRFNRKAAHLWGRTPALGEAGARFCGSFRLYRIDGVLLPHDQCPMATALQTGESFHNQEVIVEQPDGERLTVLVSIDALKDDDGRVRGAVNCFRDITERKRADDRQRQLIQELNHRVRNTLATVLSMAANTARNATSIDEFTGRFGARLLALSRAQTLLSEDRWSSAGLRDLLEQQLEPFGDDGSSRVRIEGPDVDLEPRLALDLSMMFHELMTNAAKYGSLSVAGGRISVEWDLLTASGGDRTLILRWLESGGPTVSPPRRSGFGTRLIKTITNGLGGEGNLIFEPSGVQLRASIPLPN